jgi:hypothetical protein
MSGKSFRSLKLAPNFFLTSSLIKEDQAKNFLRGVGNTCLQGGGPGAGQEGGADTGHPGQERRQGGGDQAPGPSLTLFYWVTRRRPGTGA